MSRGISNGPESCLGNHSPSPATEPSPADGRTAAGRRVGGLIPSRQQPAAHNPPPGWLAKDGPVSLVLVRDWAQSLLCYRLPVGLGQVA